MPQDPFEEVRGEVTRSLASAEEQLASWKKKKTETAKQQLLANLRNIEADLQDLEEALVAIKADRKRFPVSDSELQSRHKFVETSRNVVSAHRKEVSSASTSKRSEGDGLGAGAGEAERDSLLSSGSKPKAGSKSTSAVRQEQSRQDAFVNSQMMQQQQLQTEQEEVLDELHQAVGSLKVMSGTMNVELSQQAQMIADLEGQVDRTSSSLDSLKSRLRKMLPQKDRKQRLIIVVLSVVLLLLIILALN